MKPIGAMGSWAYFDSFGPRLPSTRLRAAITRSPVTADAVGVWTNVVAIRVELLMQTVQNGLATSAQPYTFNGVTTTPSDLRIRTVMNSTISVRNRNP